MIGSLHEIAFFLGRLHPIVVHFPIGILFAIGLIEVISIWRPHAGLRRAIALLLMIGVASAVMTASFGILLERSGGYDESLVYRHRLLALTATSFAILALSLHGLRPQDPGRRRTIAYRASLLCCVAALTGAGHFGASLTHGTDYLAIGSAAAPSHSLGDTAAAVAIGGSAFRREIEPLFEARCHECHGPTKQKSGLRLDNRESALAGGESGESAIIPGSPLASRLIKVITLPRDHEKAMPPSGKKSLEPEEVMLLIEWIHSGAPWANPVEILAEGVEAPSAAAIEALGALGIEVSVLAEGLPLLRVDGLPAGLDLSALDPVAAQVTWLDLSEFEFTPADVQRLAAMKNLTRLELQRSNVSDADLRVAAGFENLVYLNLYDTPVGDAGIAHLHGLDSLEKLFLWQTSVSDAAVGALQEALPDARIDRGHDTPVDWTGS